MSLSNIPGHSKKPKNTKKTDKSVTNNDTKYAQGGHVNCPRGFTLIGGQCMPPPGTSNKISNIPMHLRNQSDWSFCCWENCFNYVAEYVREEYGYGCDNNMCHGCCWEYIANDEPSPSIPCLPITSESNQTGYSTSWCRERDHWVQGCAGECVPSDGCGFSVSPDDDDKSSISELPAAAPPPHASTSCSTADVCKPFITEIAYNVPPLYKGWGQKPYEYIEIYNPCNNFTINLNGWTLSNLKNCSGFSPGDYENSCNACEEQILYEFDSGDIIPPGGFIFMVRTITTWLDNCGEGAKWDYMGRCHDGTPCFPDKWYEMGGRMNHDSGTYEILEQGNRPTDEWTVPDDYDSGIECENIDGWGRITCQRGTGLGPSTDGSTYDSMSTLVGATDCMGIDDEDAAQACDDALEVCYSSVIEQCRAGDIPGADMIPDFNWWSHCNDCDGNYTELEWIQNGCTDQTAGECIDTTGDGIIDTCSFDFGNYGDCSAENQSNCIGNCEQPGENCLACCCAFANCAIQNSICITEAYDWEAYHGSEVEDICNQQAKPDNYCHPVSETDNNHPTHDWQYQCCIDGRYYYNTPVVSHLGKCCYCASADDCTPDNISSCETFLIGTFLQCVGDANDPANPGEYACSQWDEDVCKGAPFSNWASSGFPYTATDYWPNDGPAAWDFFKTEYCANDPITGDIIGNPYSWGNCADDIKDCGDQCPDILLDNINVDSTLFPWNAALHDPDATAYTTEGSLYSTHYLSCGELIQLKDYNGSTATFIDYTKKNISGLPPEWMWGSGFGGASEATPRLRAPHDPNHPNPPPGLSWNNYVNTDNRNWHISGNSGEPNWITPNFDSGDYQSYSTESCFGDPTIPGCTDSDACNYNQYATEDDGNCEYGWLCWNGNNCCDDQNEMECCPIEVVGCMDESCENYDPDANSEGECIDCEPWTCFTAGTKVKMADGSEKNIEDIKVGDKLMGKTKNTIDVPGTPWIIIYEKT